MQIAYVCNEYPPRRHGGLGIYVRELAHAVVSRGHSATVVGLGDSQSDEWDEGVRVVTLKKSSVRGAAWFLNRRRLHGWLSQAAARFEIDLVEVPEYEGMLPFALKTAPVVVRLHNSATVIAAHAGRRVSRTLSWCERQTLSSHREWAAGSEHAFGLAREGFSLSPRARWVWDVPVSERRSGRTLRLPARFILFAGRVREAKGALLLADAARELLAEDETLNLVYVGDVLMDNAGNPMDARIRDTLGPKLQSRVHFLGGVPHEDVLEVMSRATVFSLPSFLEASPLVVAEAMVEGCPVVVPEGPPFDEVVEGSVSGVLVPARDADALRHGLRQVLEDPQLASRISACAKERARRRFSPEAVAAKALVAYEEVRTRWATEHLCPTTHGNA